MEKMWDKKFSKKSDLASKGDKDNIAMALQTVMRMLKTELVKIQKSVGVNMQVLNVEPSEF